MYDNDRAFFSRPERNIKSEFISERTERSASDRFVLNSCTRGRILAELRRKKVARHVCLL